jgi:hypothetical protein
MGYEIVLGDKALERVEKATLPVQVIDFLERELAHLARSPTTLSRATSFPYPPQGQRYGFHCDLDRKRYYFGVFFLYGQDEQSLHVFDVTVVVEDIREPP